MSLGTTLLCKSMGARVVGVEFVQERRELAHKLGIADIVYPERSKDIGSTLLEVTNGEGFELAIDCSGNANARHMYLDAVRDWDSVVLLEREASSHLNQVH